MVDLDLTYLDSSFEVKLFLVNFWSQGGLNEKSISVLGCREHGETDTLVLFWFQASSFDSIPVPPNFQQVSSGTNSISNPPITPTITPVAPGRNQGGTGMELARNQIWTRVPVSLCSHYRSINFSFASDLPRGRKMVKKLGMLNDRPKWVK